MWAGSLSSTAAAGGPRRHWCHRNAGPAGHTGNAGNAGPAGPAGPHGRPLQLHSAAASVAGRRQRAGAAALPASADGPGRRPRSTWSVQCTVHALLSNNLPGPNLTKVGTSPFLEWGRPTSPLQWTNGDGSRWRLSAGGATCRRTAAASA